ncbi:MAG TPA: hypothetical protein QGI07_03610 [Dehalococcoidia bacterium]|jgi:hypothetical protein|nr:hypothetical protein [Dehalococcoidia bacterium]MDP6273884.1 hypothetical protein [Dehalococcoidia bacterium]MDP7161443.1 hypothetical protein [Dehalococcoidia bacterium]MDP7213026.1 hypothetical protein [Dehalococcoidia bacterium]MDP7514508.1 hypothetical protein [Dehalococcoidia bacterium]
MVAIGEYSWFGDNHTPIEPVIPTPVGIQKRRNHDHASSDQKP